MRSVVTVDLDDRALQRRIREAMIALGPQGGKGLMSAIGLMLKRSTADKFRAQGDGESEWEPLAESTIWQRRDVQKASATVGRRKTRAGRERAQERLSRAIGELKILDDDGTLRRSIEYEASATQVDIGTDIFYGAFHQEGTRDMPRRRFLTVTARDSAEGNRLVDRYLQRMFT